MSRKKQQAVFFTEGAGLMARRIPVNRAARRQIMAEARKAHAGESPEWVEIRRKNAAAFRRARRKPWFLYA